MSSIFGLLGDIAESIISIPVNIIKGIGELFADLFKWLNPFDNDFILKDLLNWLNPFSEDFILAKIINWLNPFSEEFILKIFFEWITNLLKEIFVPDTDLLRENFNTMLFNVSSMFGISFNDLNAFQNSWTDYPTENITANYNIYGVGTLNLKFFDTTYLIQGVDRFRPVIRGFVVFLLLLYNYYQVLTFIGQDPKIAHNAEQAAEKHLSRKEK